MTPYYQDESVTIHHGDCREVLLSLTADVMITDPPFGVGMESYVDDFAAGVAGVALCPGKRGALFMSPRRVVEAAVAIQPWSVERMLWMHKTADIAAPWRGWCMNSEAILVVAQSRSEWPPATTFRSDTYTVGPWERGGHPNGKPLAVIRDLVMRLSLSSEVIVDPFMGSGTTLRAAKDLGRKTIGIDIEERYCEIAANRLAQEVLAL